MGERHGAAAYTKCILSVYSLRTGELRERGTEGEADEEEAAWRLA